MRGGWAQRPLCPCAFSFTSDKLTQIALSDLLPLSPWRGTVLSAPLLGLSAEQSKEVGCLFGKGLPFCLGLGFPFILGGLYLITFLAR